MTEVIMTAKNKKIFVPFQHDDLELKNSLIEYARELRNKEEGGPLTAVLIYASFAEYLGEHLLENLRHVVYQNTFNSFAGILYIDQRNRGDRKTTGTIIYELESFNFPGKPETMDILKAIGAKRNKLMHELAKAKREELQDFDNDISDIANLTEDLIEKFNTIYFGLQKILVPQEVMEDQPAEVESTPAEATSPKAAKRPTKNSG